MVPRRTRNELGDLDPLLKGESDISGEFFELAFTRSRWRNPAGFARSQLQYVQYEIEDNQIIRRHRVFLDMAPNATEVERLMASDIQAVRIQFKAQEEQWIDQWGRFGGQNGVPTAIRIQVTSSLLGDIERFYHLTQFDIAKEETDL